MCNIYIFLFQTELDKFMTPKSMNTNKKNPTQAVTKPEKEINENINPFKARQLSLKKIKSYSLENQIKILLFNSKLF